MRGHQLVILTTTLVGPLLSQLTFGKGGSPTSSQTNPRLPASSSGSTTGTKDADTKFFFGGTPSLPTTGNQAIDGGIIGLGLGALGAAVLGPTIEGALSGGNSCGRCVGFVFCLFICVVSGGGSARLAERKDSSCPPEAPAPVGGGRGRRRERRGPTLSKLSQLFFQKVV